MSMETRKPIFKMVNLRGVDSNVVAPPDSPDDGDDGPVIELLSSSSDPRSALNKRTITKLHNTLAEESSENLAALTNAVEKLIMQEGVVHTDALANKAVEFNGKSRELHEIASEPVFQSEFRNQYNRWILNRLTRSNAANAMMEERIIRVAHLIQRLGKTTEIGTSPRDARKLLAAHVVLPKDLIKKLRGADASSTKRDRKARASNPGSDESRYQKITSDILTLEKIDAVLLEKWSIAEQNETDKIPRTSSAGRGQIGFVQRMKRWLYGSTPLAETVVPVTEPLADDEFFENLKSGLSDDANAYIDYLFMNKSLTINQALQRVEDTQRDLIAEGAILHEAIALPNDNAPMPPSNDQPAPEKLEYAVKALGWGDLIVATERLIDYRAHEIAHIENVLPAEEKVRDHSRRRTVEESLETESIEENESERELETTDRYELQSESSKAIETDFSISGGVNTSGRYGLTKVETSLDVDFSRSQAESRSTSTNVAKEVVDKAIERTLKKTRELRRRSVVTEVIEANKHTLSNLQKEDADPVTAISGIYRWVEKIHEVQLRHYGKRLMLEFHIPEPAITLTSTAPPVVVDAEKPSPFTLAINALSETNYKTYAKRYRATDLEEPPERVIEVGYAWQSTPDEGTDEDQAEDTIAEKVTIPAGYQAYRVGVAVYAHPAKEKHFQIRMAVGGRGLVWEPQGSADGRDTYFRSLYLTSPQKLARRVANINARPRAF
ncbi:MAG: hypothetical protein ACR2P1_15550 [Pseudomonadales bacterium]